METLKKTHWDILYENAPIKELDRNQEVPKVSPQLIDNWAYGSNAQIIDLGGGNTNLAEQLIDKGYSNISILDVSGDSLKKVKEQLGSKSNIINWIVSDLMDFESTIQYDVWHDIAIFNFLNEEKNIDKYVDIASNGVVSGGYLIISAFSDCGPVDNSGIEVIRYDEETLSEVFGEKFDLKESVIFDHETEFNAYQQLVYCVMRRK